MFTEKEKSNLVLTTLASILAANGLITNSVSGVICSMLVSPYISAIVPIANDIFNGTLNLRNIGVLGSYVGVSLVVGIVYYLVQRNILGVDKIDVERQKSEMINRAELNRREYASILVYAAVCGVILGFITGNPTYTESTRTIVAVGVSIGVSLLPAVVNSGLFIIENNRYYALTSLMGMVTTVIGIILGMLGYLYFNHSS